MQRAFTKLRTFALSLSLGVCLAAASCSGDSKESKAPPPENTGGGSDVPTSIECGTSTCDPVVLASGIEPLLPCCVDGGCGLDSTFISQYGVMFNEACQAKDQPGVLGHGCPDSPMLKVPNSNTTVPALAGCCRTETKTCGYELDKVFGLFQVGLGCIDSSPFLDGGAAPECDPEE